MANLLGKLDGFLRVEKLSRTSDKLRVRAVYMIAFALIISQAINIAIMSHTYGYWTFDHTISLVAALSFALSVIALRYCKAFYIYASFYSLLLFASIAAVSTIDFTGINSALLPFLVFGTIVCGFISGWRMVILYTTIAIGLVWFLYYTSMAAPQGALFDLSVFSTRNFQRAIQVTIILGLSAAISAFASHSMHSAFFELEETAELANRANEAKTQFMSDMSHELRTPLNGMIGMSGLLLKSKMDPTQQQYIEIINKCSQNLFGIIEDVLDISRIDAGRFVIKKAPFNLRKLMENLIDLYKPVTINSDVNIGLEYPSDLPSEFYGDETAIRQIVNNFMSNAMKFTEKGSVTLNIKGRLLPHDISKYQGEQAQTYQICISVTDTGIGIAPENVEKAFERFSQLDQSLSRDQDGTGLGLAVSRKVAELMDGNIIVTSQLGKGSSFTLDIELPTKKIDNVTVPPIDNFHPLPQNASVTSQTDYTEAGYELEEIKLETG